MLCPPCSGPCCSYEALHGPLCFGQAARPRRSTALLHCASTQAGEGFLSIQLPSALHIFPSSSSGPSCVEIRALLSQRGTDVWGLSSGLREMQAIC